MLTPRTVKSSNLAWVGYDHGTVFVAFRDHKAPGKVKSLYTYPNQTPQVYAAMFRAKSKGKYFAKHFRPLAVYNKVF